MKHKETRRPPAYTYLRSPQVANVKARMDSMQTRTLRLHVPPLKRITLTGLNYFLKSPQNNVGTVA
jgi:hypothetical protein